MRQDAVAGVHPERVTRGRPPRPRAGADRHGHRLPARRCRLGGRPGRRSASRSACRLPERLAAVGGELAVTAVDPPWFGPDGAAAGPPGRADAGGRPADPGQSPGMTGSGAAAAGAARGGGGGQDGAGATGAAGRRAQRDAAPARPPGPGLLPAAAGRHGRGVAPGGLGRRVRALRPVAAGGAGPGAGAGHDGGGDVRAGQPGDPGRRPPGGAARCRRVDGSSLAPIGDQSWRSRWPAPPRAGPDSCPPAAGARGPDGPGQPGVGLVRPIGPATADAAGGRLRPGAAAARGSRSACSTRRSRSAGGRAPARRRSGWPRRAWYTSPGVHLRGHSGGYNTDPAAEQLRRGPRWSGSAPGGRAWPCAPTSRAASPASAIWRGRACAW